MRVVVHIGVHKTGTSALQYFLSTNRLLLRSRGIFYEPEPGQTNNTTLAIGMRKGNAAHHEWARIRFQTLLSAATAHGCDSLLMSSEEFTGERLDMDVMQALLTGHQVTVIAYMRSADELVTSAYNQSVREYSIRRTTPANADPFAYDATYSLPLEPWMKYLDPGSLILAPYDTPQLTGHTIFCDFLEMLGVNDKNHFDYTVPLHEANSSMSMPLIEHLRLFNRVPLSEATHLAIVAQLREIELNNKELCELATKSLLTANERRLLRQRTEANLSKFSPFFRPGFDDRFLRSETVPEVADKVWQSDPERDLSRVIFFQLLQNQQNQIAELAKRLEQLENSLPDRSLDTK